jgi:hypothetical protein
MTWPSDGSEDIANVFPGPPATDRASRYLFLPSAGAWFGLCVADGYGQHLANWPWSLTVRAPPSRFAIPGYRALPLIPRQRPVSLFFHVLRNEGVELFASGTILFVLEVLRQFASYYFHQVL